MYPCSANLRFAFAKLDADTFRTHELNSISEIRYKVSGSSSWETLLRTAASKIRLKTASTFVSATLLKVHRYSSLSAKVLPLISISCGREENSIKWLWKIPVLRSAKYNPKDSATAAGSASWIRKYPLLPTHFYCRRSQEGNPRTHRVLPSLRQLNQPETPTDLHSAQI